MPEEAEPISTRPLRSSRTMPEEDWTLAATSRALRERWESGHATFGAWATIGDSYLIELLARTGFDWIGIDMQHGLVTGPQLTPMLQACAITQTPVLVRVPGHTPEQTLQALDAGANGVIVPLIDTAEEAAAAVAACRHPPAGTRSWGATRAPLGAESYTAADANEAVLCAVMVETAKAVEDVAAIVSVPGVDAIFVGPRDLRLSLGEPGQAQLDEAILTVRDACADAGVVAGIYAGSAAAALRWASEGFQLVTVISDGNLVRQSARETLAEVRQRPERADGQDVGY
ncbi:MAG TPA: aldolase/citrate lyase family protein [Solirubrobacteraceae bacterium]|jgi:4-hydroxy-2-oxoheptanedioate aldolase